MTWFKVDDGLWKHKKVRRLGRDRLSAIGLWLLVGNWCSDTGTGGFAPADLVAVHDPNERLARRLVEVGLWHHDSHDGEDGYRFHDWDEYQPTEEEQRAARANKSSGGRLGNHRRWHVLRGVSDPRCPYCAPETGRTTDRSSDRVTDHTTDRRPIGGANRGANRTRIAETSPVPDPTRYLSPHPSQPTSPLAALGLTEREIDKTEEAIMLAQPTIRNLNAFIAKLIDNGDIQRYIAEAREAIADDVPRIPDPGHPWNPDHYDEGCQDCPMPRARHKVVGL